MAEQPDREDTVTTQLRSIRDTIGDRMIDGEPFGDVEDFVNQLDVDDDIKAALWLYAWTHMPPAQQRTIALEHLVAVSG